MINLTEIESKKRQYIASLAKILYAIQKLNGTIENTKKNDEKFIKNLDQIINMELESPNFINNYNEIESELQDFIEMAMND